MFINKKIGIIIICLGSFFTIGALVLSNATMVFDKTFQDVAFSMRGDLLTKLLKMVTYSGNWETIAVICLMLLIIKKTRIIAGIPISIAAAVSTITYKIIKTLYGRPRPDVELHLIAQGGLSFPSGHAMTGIVFYGLLFYFVFEYGKENRAQKILLFLFPILIVFIGFSRVYLGVHYPTDVVAGWLLGASILTSAIILLEKKHPKEI
jgi:undecaprenyl-diphosphatase